MNGDGGDLGFGIEAHRLFGCTRFRGVLLGVAGLRVYVLFDRRDPKPEPISLHLQSSDLSTII